MRFRHHSLVSCLFAVILATTAGAQALSTLPFGSTCAQPNPNTNRALGIDAAGNLFVIANCGGNVDMTTSIDGGLTWSAIVNVATGAQFMVVEGGTLPGHAIVAWFDGSSVRARTTTNFGASFSAPTTIFTSGSIIASQGLDAVAEGTNYHVMTIDLSTFPSQVLTRRSLDRGASWQAQVAVPVAYVFGDLIHDDTSGNMELVIDDPNVYRSFSTDGGASYSPYVGLPGGCCIYYSDWAGACGTRIYASGNNLGGFPGPGGDLIWRWDFSAGPGAPEQVMTLEGCISQSRSVDGDDNGNAYTAGTATLDGRIVLNRWLATQPGVDPDITVTPSGQNAHVRACRADTAYVVYFNNNTARIEFQRFCFGTACCVPGTCGAPLAPTCDAGSAYTAECGGVSTLVPLDGTGSSDPAGLTLTYAWTTDCAGGSFDDPASPSPTLMLDSSAPCPLTCNVSLTVDNGSANSSCGATVTVSDSLAPSVTPGVIDACYQSVGAAEAAALAATSASDGCDAVVDKSAATVGTCDAQITVTATDDCGNASSVTYFTRIDGDAPTVTSAGTVLACLWPPNHKYVLVSASSITPTLTDNCPGPLTWSVLGCSSSQPDNGLGDGNTEQDCIVAPDGQSIMVRAERQGGDPAGRDYAVEVVATDGCGNVSLPATGATVHVPHDSRPNRRCAR